MTYAPSTLLAFEDFIAGYGDNPRYELADGELIDMEPTGHHETYSVSQVDAADLRRRAIGNRPYIYFSMRGYTSLY